MAPMVTLAVTEAITSIKQAEESFGLVSSMERQFFTEWYTDLTTLTTAEEASCDRIKRSYEHNSAEGPLTESSINLLLVSPLLYLSNLCDPPFKLRAETTVDITADEGDLILRGRIDALTLQDQLWIVLVESKQAKFSFSSAIPQALAYMMASPQTDRPVFAMVTNGDVFLFIKLLKTPTPTYALSDDFSLFRQSHNQLYDVLKILKVLKQGF
jgi:hypothetical protein